jgi:hypothetical protein
MIGDKSLNYPISIKSMIHDSVNFIQGFHPDISLHLNVKVATAARSDRVLLGDMLVRGFDKPQ